MQYFRRLSLDTILGAKGEMHSKSGRTRVIVRVLPVSVGQSRSER